MKTSIGSLVRVREVRERVAEQALRERRRALDKAAAELDRRAAVVAGIESCVSHVCNTRQTKREWVPAELLRVEQHVRNLRRDLQEAEGRRKEASTIREKAQVQYRNTMQDFLRAHQRVETTREVSDRQDRAQERKREWMEEEIANELIRKPTSQEAV